MRRLSAAAAGTTVVPARTQKTRCQLRGCQEKQFRDEGVLHDFCCRGHAQLAKARGDWPPPNSRGSVRCALPGCKKAVYCDPSTGKASAFCSMKHVKKAKSRKCLRIECSRLAGCERKALRFVSWQSLHFCSESHRVLHAASEQPPVPARTSTEPYTTKVIGTKHGVSTVELHFLDEGHPEHKSLSDQFISKWEHEKPRTGVKVMDIIKIEMPREIRQKHEDYKKTVPNVRRRFHGTFSSISCRFYVGGSMCLRPDCGLCSICMRGFKLEDNVGTSPTRGSRTRWLMYGRGIYFSSVSGKANDFAKPTAKVAADGTMVRCMLVADVAAGNAFLTHEKDFPEMTEPPLGYHSIVGEVGPHLNYDELVVYDPAAALPTHFIVYRH